MLQCTLNPNNETDSIIIPFGARQLPDYLTCCIGFAIRYCLISGFSIRRNGSQRATELQIRRNGLNIIL